jgi:hypothetical protein
MARPLQVKIFMDSRANVIEEQVNAWLASQTSVSIVKTETAISAGAGKPSDTDTGGPWFAVTIWYEPPAPDRERPGFRVA